MNNEDDYPGKKKSLSRRQKECLHKSQDDDILVLQLRTILKQLYLSIPLMQSRLQNNRSKSLNDSSNKGTTTSYKRFINNLKNFYLKSSISPERKFTN